MKLIRLLLATSTPHAVAIVAPMFFEYFKPLQYQKIQMKLRKD